MTDTRAGGAASVGYDPVGDASADDRSFDVAAFDLDGTLVDSNYQHSLAWFRAFRAYDITLPMWRIHRSIGMGGDQIVAFAGARELLIAARERGFRVVLASSGSPEHTDHYIELLDARDLIDAATTSEDVESTKPAPDLVHVAVDKVHGQRGILVGDSTWDCQSAAEAAQ